MARKCVELQRESNRTLPTVDLLIALVAQDSGSRIRSIIRSCPPKEVAQYLWGTVDLLSAVTVEDPRTVNLDRSELRSPAPEAAIPITQSTDLLFLLIQVIRQRLDSGSEWDDIDDRLILVAEAVARAVQHRGDEAHIRDSTYSIARSQCGGVLKAQVWSRPSPGRRARALATSLWRGRRGIDRPLSTE